MPRTVTHTARALLLFALLGVGAAPPPAGRHARAQPDELDPGTSSLPCFVTARRETTLFERDAFALCRGARTVGPVRCYQFGDRKTVLSQQRLIRLCQCARSTAPVRCYERFRRELLLDEALIVEECRPIVARQLTSQCIPIREL
jgi:hypothetical protein